MAVHHQRGRQPALTELRSVRRPGRDRDPREPRPPLSGPGYRGLAEPGLVRPAGQHPGARPLRGRSGGRSRRRMVSEARLKPVWTAASISPRRLQHLKVQVIGVRTNGSAAAIEQVRTVLVTAFPYQAYPVTTIGNNPFNSTLAGEQQLANVMILVSLPIAGCTLAVSVAGGPGRPQAAVQPAAADRRPARPAAPRGRPGERGAAADRRGDLDRQWASLAAQLFLTSQLHYSLRPPGPEYYLDRRGRAGRVPRDHRVHPAPAQPDHRGRKPPGTNAGCRSQESRQERQPVLGPQIFSVGREESNLRRARPGLVRAAWPHSCGGLTSPCVVLHLLSRARGPGAQGKTSRQKSRRRWRPRWPGWSRGGHRGGEPAARGTGRTAPAAECLHVVAVAHPDGGGDPAGPGDGQPRPDPPQATLAPAHPAADPGVGQSSAPGCSRNADAAAVPAEPERAAAQPPARGRRRRSTSARPRRRPRRPPAAASRRPAPPGRHCRWPGGRRGDLRSCRGNVPTTRTSGVLAAQDAFICLSPAGSADEPLHQPGGAADRVIHGVHVRVVVDQDPARRRAHVPRGLAALERRGERVEVAGEHKHRQVARRVRGRGDDRRVRMSRGRPSPGTRRTPPPARSPTRGR